MPSDRRVLTIPTGRAGTSRTARAFCVRMFSRFPDMMSDRGATVCTHKVTCSNAGRSLERSVRDGSVRATRVARVSGGASRATPRPCPELLRAARRDDTAARPGAGPRQFAALRAPQRGAAPRDVPAHLAARRRERSHALGARPQHRAGPRHAARGVRGRGGAAHRDRAVAAPRGRTGLRTARAWCGCRRPRAGALLLRTTRRTTGGGCCAARRTRTGRARTWRTLLETAFAHQITQAFGRPCRAGERGLCFSLYEHAFLLRDGRELSLWEVEHTATPDGRHRCEVYPSEEDARAAMERACLRRLGGIRPVRSLRVSRGLVARCPRGPDGALPAPCAWSDNDGGPGLGSPGPPSLSLSAEPSGCYRLLRLCCRRGLGGLVAALGGLLSHALQDDDQARGDARAGAMASR